ncbi:MAG: YggT family protein [bacterium]|nr:YggT family protein [bacterium]
MLVLVCALLRVFVYLIIARVILSWVRVPRDHPVGRLVEALSRVVDPPLRSIGRALPAIPVGTARLDLSPLVLLVVIGLVTRIICR